MLAKKFLSTPASSVYSERLFSGYENIFEEKRSRLLPKSREKRPFLHHNMKLLINNELDSYDIESVTVYYS